MSRGPTPARRSAPATSTRLTVAAASAAAALSACAALALPGCGTGAGDGGGMSNLPSAGLGPYRVLESIELNNERAVPAIGWVESAMVVGTRDDAVAFYAWGFLRPPPPRDAGMPDADVPDGDIPDGEVPDGAVHDAGAPDGEAPDAAALDAETLDAGPADGGAALDPVEVDRSKYQPRVIFRSAPSRLPRMEPGERVLAAEAAWEGDEVFDPWAVVLPDGRTRLYYAAAGGIGLAEAPTRGGAFVRVGAGPLLAAGPRGAPIRRPTVVRDPASAGYLLFAESGGRIVRSRSADGVAWSAPEDVALDLAADAGVVSVGTPGAVLAVPEIGPPRVVLFFSARTGDGTPRLGIAASLDGVAFERALLPAFPRNRAESFPAPVYFEPGAMLLYFASSDTQRGERARKIEAAVSPGRIRFDRPPSM
jgi:hypothetical protein